MAQADKIIQNDPERFTADDFPEIPKITAVSDSLKSFSTRLKKTIKRRRTILSSTDNDEENDPQGFNSDFTMLLEAIEHLSTKMDKFDQLENLISEAVKTEIRGLEEKNSVLVERLDNLKIRP